MCVKRELHLFHTPKREASSSGKIGINIFHGSVLLYIKRSQQILKLCETHLVLSFVSTKNQSEKLIECHLIPVEVTVLPYNAVKNVYYFLNETR